MGTAKLWDLSVIYIINQAKKKFQLLEVLTVPLTLLYYYFMGLNYTNIVTRWCLITTQILIVVKMKFASIAVHVVPTKSNNKGRVVNRK